MGCDSKLLYLARDLELTTLRDEGPVVHWSPSSTWQAASGARLVRCWGQLLGEQNASVTLVAQTSLDGKIWTDVEVPGSSGTVDNLLGTALSSSAADVSNVYIPPSVSWGPLVRFGLQVDVASTGVPQPYARVTASIQPIHCGAATATPASFTDKAVTGTTSYARITDTPTAIPTMNLDNASFNGTAALDGANDLDVAIQGAASASASSWWTLTEVNLTEDGPFALTLDVLPPWVRLVAKHDMGTNPEVSGALTVRARS